ncbi:hypothetical protein OUZ56_011919 [Daphnia magna]|uniref:Uncharacterized protein n=1 Tax=Daphnia magna TaxID=35525 RepID=A0ABQ9Z1N8_9CRUS|nr:hypothetical protein OUZ56_011919 [Daphnia magna]
MSSKYANAEKLQQDHPCVIHLIRKNYLRQPASRYQPYHLNDKELADPSDGQSKVNKTDFLYGKG